ncbi:hypothetical protein K2Q00_02865 [Patescibacteria group bacterium]|nr:hypothetical protein [Patescibacteria group bacterium]
MQKIKTTVKDLCREVLGLLSWTGRVLLSFLCFLGSICRLVNHHIRLTLLIIGVFLALLFPFPNILLNHDYKLVASTTPSKTDKGTIAIGNAYLSSDSLIARVAKIAGQEFKSPAISVCLVNNSKPTPAGLEFASTTDTSELGALSLTVRDTEGQPIKEIYAKLGTTSCQTFPTGHIKIGPDVVYKGMFLQTNMNGQQYLLEYLDFGNTEVRVRVKFDINEYLFLSFVTFLAIVGIFQLMRVFLRRKD